MPNPKMDIVAHKWMNLLLKLNEMDSKLSIPKLFPLERVEQDERRAMALINDGFWRRTIDAFLVDLTLSTSMVIDLL